MGMFDRKSQYKKEDEEAEKEEARKEELIKKAADDKSRQAEETRKQMEALKEKQAARRSTAGEGDAGAPKSRVNRAGGASSMEVDEINQAIQQKAEEKKKKQEAEKKRKEEEQAKLKEEALARGEEWVEAKESKWGTVVKGNLGGAALRLKQIQEKNDAAKAAALGLDPNQVKGGGTAAEAARAAAPTRTVTIAEKLAARNAAVQACGVFLTYEENKQREEQMAKLRAKIAELEKKSSSTSVASAVASKVRRMSLTSKKPEPSSAAGLDGLHPDLLGGGGGSTAEPEDAKPKPQRRRSILQRVMGQPGMAVQSTSLLDA